VQALGIFVKAPIPGRVKTRLAGELGPRGAAEVYRRMGRQVVTATVGRGYRTTVWFTPRSKGLLVREWLDSVDMVAFRPQVGTGLGARLSAAFAREFRAGARRVVMIGSDCPGVDRAVVREAFRALAKRDLVLGPAVDGGYYLIGLAAPAPGLFRGIAWSTEAVAGQTLARAAALGLSYQALSPLRDVDTARDAQAWGLLNY
jgi:uncharacterized protein